MRHHLTDYLKSTAIIMMIAFHFLWHLDYFDVIQVRYFTLYNSWGKTIGALFFFCAGINLYWVHHQSYRPKKFFFHIVKIGLAAMGISIATWLLFPSMWIFFGVLHSLTISMLVAIWFVPFPATALVLGVLILLLSYLLDIYFPTYGFFIKYWGAANHTFDFYPLIPWLGFCLCGIFFAHQAPHLPSKAPHRILLFLSQNSLAVYLIHPPVIYGLLYLIYR